MVDASKILTVSYGTFSCTLEGFDDPFSTMRGIAEYFRDLAAEDRYFGAEPPTPDAEMLHRIAEREVQQRVEARVESDSITLRQMEGTPMAGSALAAVAQQTEEPVAEPTPAGPVQTTAPAESVAAKLARIRALSSEDEFESNGYASDIPSSDQAIEAEPISAAFDDDYEDSGSDGISEVEVVEADVEEEVEAKVEIETDVATDDGDEADDDVAAEEDLMDATEEAPADIADPDADTGADQDEKVSELAEDVEAADEEIAEMVADSDGDTDMPEEIEAAQDDSASAEDASDEDADQTVAQSQTEETDAVDAEPSDDPAVEAQPDDADDAEDKEDETSGSIASIIGASLDQSDAGDDAEEEAEEPFPTDEVTDEPDSVAIARVVKMRRSDFEAAQETADAQIEESQDDFPELVEPGEEPLELVSEAETPEEHAEEDTAETSSLSDEDEADLMATLEEVKRQEAADMRSEKEGHAILQSQDIEGGDDSVSRILDVTNTEMEESEGSRRRSAIAHLKAAVAATRADKLLGRLKPKDDSEEMDKYRDDLAKVVRPRRQSPIENPTTRRLAPLVLVEDQRIEDQDEDNAPENTAVVAPRRISADDLSMEEEGEAAENMFRDGHSFAEFAQEMGAKELPDLLEAAAAFSAFVEGREHFSRPEIMKTVADLNEDEDFSREESLRSFGMLLRRGKIKKIKRGQFIIADTTRFNPEVRAAGE